MKKSQAITSLIGMLVLIGVSAAALSLGARPNLGLDLQGGISAVYTPELLPGEEEPEDFEEVLDETIEVIRARVDSLGVAEPDIARSGTDIVVQLPGVADAERVQEIIGTTAQLEFRPVWAAREPSQEPFDDTPDCDLPIDERPVLRDDESGILCGEPEQEGVQGPDGVEVRTFQTGPVQLTGASIGDARPVIEGQGFSVSLDLEGEGAAAFQSVSSDLACLRDALAASPGAIDADDPRLADLSDDFVDMIPGQAELAQLAIVLDGQVFTSLNMGQDVLCGRGLQGSASLTVNTATEDRGEQQATDLSLILRAGALPITLEASTFETVSATLGVESLRAGILAGLIGLGLVAAWMIGFYRWLGVVAITELLVFGALLAGIIAALGELAGYALTLAGVAGIIVSIGITADSSILYRERIREEINFGRTPRMAVHAAFAPTFRANLSGNTVTLMAALVLYFLSVGPVRGFALMLGIATALDLMIFATFTRPVVELLAKTKLVSRESMRALPKSQAQVRPEVTRKRKERPARPEGGTV